MARTPTVCATNTCASPSPSREAWSRTSHARLRVARSERGGSKGGAKEVPSEWMNAGSGGILSYARNLCLHLVPISNLVKWCILDRVEYDVRPQTLVAGRFSILNGSCGMRAACGVLLRQTGFDCDRPRRTSPGVHMGSCGSNLGQLESATALMDEQGVQKRVVEHHMTADLGDRLYRVALSPEQWFPYTRITNFFGYL